MGKSTTIIRAQLPEIREKINSCGQWVFILEWGVGKETYIKIAEISDHDKIWYEVTAELSHTFKCKCPTIERAAEFADIYEDLIFNLYKKYGWPSWHSPTEL